VSVTASDVTHLQGWFARPADANGNAVILLHGVGDNRQGMMGFAELFLFGMGESTGAAIVFQAAQTTPLCRGRRIIVLQLPPDCICASGSVLSHGRMAGQNRSSPSSGNGIPVRGLTRGVNLADASPESSVVGGQMPILLIHGLADDNIPPQQSVRIRAHNPAEIVLREVPNAGHCSAVNAAGQEFDTRVLGWFTFA
jgi:uncharacterized protein